VDITTVHEDLLTGCMPRFGGSQKYRRCRDFLSGGPSLARREVRNDDPASEHKLRDLLALQGVGIRPYKGPRRPAR